MKKYQNKTSKKVAVIEQTITLPTGKLITLKHEDGKLEQLTEANFKKRWVLVETKSKKQQAIDGLNKAIDTVAKEMRVSKPKKKEEKKTTKKKEVKKTTKKNVKQTTQKGSKKVNRRKNKLEKITYEELVEKFEEFNKEHEFDADYHIAGVIVVDQVCFSNKLSVEERSYKVLSTSPFFMHNGNEIFGTCLDGKENVELGQYINDDDLVIEYCYLEEVK